MEAVRSCEDLKVQEKNIMNSSPEGSPTIEMDTSLEVNGGKSDNQQFCLRWNNHQVSQNYFFTPSLNESIITTIE